MNPFFFGASERPLFGVYHAPRAPGYPGSGVVFCYPFGWEYMRTHRAFRQLATRMSRAGLHVLRFDYYGTGDSGGNGSEASLEGWLADTSTAVDELKDTAGLRKVSIVGLRLGALLAARLGARRGDLDRLVLWDPVVDGEAYVRELADQAARIRGTGERGREGAVRDVGGYPFTARMRDELMQVNLMRLRGLQATSVLIVTSQPSVACEELASTFRERGLESGCSVVPRARDRTEQDELVSAILPNEILSVILDHFTETADV